MNLLRTCRVCGLQAHTQQDLEKFVKAKRCLYGRSLLCKKCRNQRIKLRKTIPSPQKPSYLRKCRYCGFEALTESDLDKFVRRKTSPYGRHTICKKCGNERNIMNRLKNPSSDTRRRRKVELIKGFPKPIKCYFCGEEITKLFGLERDSLFIHSLDGNHENWDPENKVPSHSRCHTKFHMSDEKNLRWNPLIH